MKINRVWWLHPAAVVLLLCIPMLVASYVVPESTYIELFRTRKHMTLEFVVVGTIIYIGFILGSLLSVSFGKESQARDTFLYCRFFVWPLFLITVFGYLVWFGSAAVRAGGPGALVSQSIDLLTNPESGMSHVFYQEIFATIPGVTTLVQVGILYFTVEAYMIFRYRFLSNMQILRLSTVGALTLARIFLHSERISFIETAVPIAVMAVGCLNLRGTRRAFVRVAPIFMGAAVLTLFTVGEYFRSWGFYKSLYSGPYIQFAVERFLGYYTTATNNASLYYYQQPLAPLQSTLNPLFQFPGLGDIVTSFYNSIILGGDTAYAYPYSYILERFANPEFNNISPVGLWPNDVTVVGAPILAFVLGVISASIYRSFLRERMIGILLYPSWFVGLLDLPRIYYWTDQRYFPVLALLALTLLIFKVAKVPTPISESPRKATPGRTKRSVPSPRLTSTSRNE